MYNYTLHVSSLKAFRELFFINLTFPNERLLDFKTMQALLFPCRKLHGLQSYLVSLREDMGQMQSDMDKHSASMHEAHASTRWVVGAGSQARYCS